MLRLSGHPLTALKSEPSHQNGLAEPKAGPVVPVRTPESSSHPETELAPAPQRPPELAAVGAAAPPDAGPQPVDFSPSAVQPIGHGFMVSKLDAVERPTGVRVKGRVINTSSIRHGHLRFRIALGERSEVFAVSLISPGNSTGFQVVIPDATLDGSSIAEIEYLGSTVNYQGHSQRGLDGQVENGRGVKDAGSGPL